MIARDRASLTLAFAVAVLFGSVLDRTTGQPLAHVRISAGSAHATTDARGKYALRGVPAGSTTVGLQSDDVPMQHFDVQVGAKKTHADFRACSTTLDYNCGALAPNFGGNGG